jgi:hypothetical protein
MAVPQDGWTGVFNGITVGASMEDVESAFGGAKTKKDFSLSYADKKSVDNKSCMGFYLIRWVAGN